MKKFIIFHVFELTKLLEKNFARYPNEKKNRIDAIEAPRPNRYLLIIKKFFEKFPKKKTVSE